MTGLAGCADDQGNGDSPADTDADGDDQNEPATNSEAGTKTVRLRGELLGTKATGISVPASERTAVERTVAGELGIGEFDVRAHESAVEVYADVAAEPFVAALDTTSVAADADDIESGVTATTRERTQKVITNRLRQAGFEQETIEFVDEGNAGHAAVVEVVQAETDPEAVRSLLANRGIVTAVASYPSGNERGETRLFTHEDFASVGEARIRGGGMAPHVPVTLTRESAERFTDVLVEQGFTTEGLNACEFDASKDDPPVDDGWCIYTTLDDDIVYAAGLGPSLGQSIESGEFLDNPQFILTTATMQRARRLEQYLRSGPLPAPLDGITIE